MKHLRTILALLLALAIGAWAGIGYHQRIPITQVCVEAGCVSLDEARDLIAAELERRRVVEMVNKARGRAD